MRISVGKAYRGLGLLVAMAVGFIACESEEIITPEPEEPKPVAAFSFELDSENDPFTYSFTNGSNNFKDVRWEFGDDSSSLEISPNHTFQYTGDFRVTLRVENGQGFWAQRETVISIHPEDVFRMVTTPAGGGTLDLSVDSEAAIEAINWYKGEGPSAEHIATGDKVNIEVAAGQFQDYTVRIETPKGSTAELSHLLTDLGIVRDVTNEGNLSVSRDNSGGQHAGEGSLKLVDNDTNTKFLQFDYVGDLWFELEFFEPIALGGYTFTSANDASQRDPRDWRLEATSDGVNWTVLDTRAEETFEERFQTRTFLFDNDQEYTRYRIYVTAVGSGGLFQMAEWRMLALPHE